MTNTDRIEIAGLFGSGSRRSLLIENPAFVACASKAFWELVAKDSHLSFVTRAYKFEPLLPSLTPASATPPVK